MQNSPAYDAVIVGSGPNGLAAAIRLAQEGRSVLVIEGKTTIGGGTRTEELTLPGFRHDICSAIHPLGLASPFLQSLPLSEYGLEWVHPEIPLAHPLDGGRAVAVAQDLSATADGLGMDGKAYRRLVGPLVDRWQGIMSDFLGPLPVPPKHPVGLMQFGLRALWPAKTLAKLVFRGERAQAVFAGMAGHAIMPLEWPSTAAFGLMLGVLAHAVGWPVARGGSHAITQAMAGYLQSLGGKIETKTMVASLEQLPRARTILFDITPRQVLQIAGAHLHPGYRRQLENYQYGAGVCKVDWALNGPVPWQAEAPRRAGTVHVGGTLEEIALAERAVWQGKHPEHPFVLLAQQSLCDPCRAPEGKQTVWAYCHVPHGSTQDVSDRMESQIERFAPGFRDRILARRVHTSMQMAAYNPNYIGGDINGGVQHLRQLYTRPAIRWNPYYIPTQGRPNGGAELFLCSSSTPPGGGVHGMCGYYAAEAALKRI